jgi:DNA repair exonuclease SbcCD nuclease subunit
VFTNLYNQLKDEVKTGLGGDNKKGLIVITGDILHSKTELSPECVSLTADFFQKLAKIMPLVLIAGNHDANLNNNSRMDSLTPIVEKVISKSQCYYLRESGFYRFNNLIFGLTSVFDYNFTKADHISDLNLKGLTTRLVYSMVV